MKLVLTLTSDLKMSLISLHIFYQTSTLNVDEAENVQKMKTLYNIPKMFSNEKPKQSAGIFNEHRQLIIGSTEQQERWKQHFCEVLNGELPDNPLDDEETNEICEIFYSEEPSILEIINASRKLKNGNSPGIDNIILKQNF